MFKEINTNTKLLHIPFPSIGQFSNVVYNVNNKCHYVGQDENNEPIYDTSILKPKLKFLGTNKLHGTNAAIIIDKKNEVIYFQSKENVIIPTIDNAGCAAYLASIQMEILDMVNSSSCFDAVNWNTSTLAIYGEWCGGNIQKTVALNGLDKMFVIIAIAVVDIETKQKEWFVKDIMQTVKLQNRKIYNIYDYPTFEIEIDFENVHLSTNKIIDMTLEVEDMCPVGKAFGVEGIGEGIVFQCITEPFNGNSGFWFKSKGVKHSNSKVKTIKPVDNEKVAKLMDIADLVTPSWRLEQMFNLTLDTLNGGQITRSKIGDFLKAVNNDICKEDLHIFTENNVEFKDVVTYVTKISKDYFLQMEKDFLEGK